jgi:hypothetical protein
MDVKNAAADNLPAEDLPIRSVERQARSIH